MRLSSSFGLVVWCCAGIAYILSISIGVGGGVEGGVGVHTFIGEGDRCVVSVWWAFREVRITWRACADFIQASQDQGSSWCIQGSMLRLFPPFPFLYAYHGLFPYRYPPRHLPVHCHTSLRYHLPTWLPLHPYLGP